MKDYIVESFLDNILRNIEKDTLFNLYTELFKFIEKIF